VRVNREFGCVCFFFMGSVSFILKF
jgi:hypothetical protein